MSSMDFKRGYDIGERTKTLQNKISYYSDPENTEHQSESMREHIARIVLYANKELDELFAETKLRMNQETLFDAGSGI